jgi:hypothetical protein
MIERTQLPVEALIVDSAQSRQGAWTGDEQDQRLVNSLQREGLLQPLLVRPVEATEYGADVEATHAVIAGSRRYHAALEAGFETVACRVLDAGDYEAARISLRENEERKALSDGELARSLRTQFELLRPPDPVTCPACGESFAPDGIASHWASVDHGPIDPEISDDGGLDGLTFYTDQQVYEHLARAHFGSERSSAIDKIRHLISIAELPDPLRALWTPPEQRSAAETEQLARHGITRQLHASGAGNDLSPRVRRLFRTFEETADTDGLDPTTATLETVGRLDQSGLADNRLAHEVAEFRETVVEELERVSGSEQRRRFEETLSERATALREMAEQLDSQPGVGQVRIEFGDQRYRRWHARVKQLRGEENNTAVVAQAYRDYLERMADKHGWANE